MDPIRNPYTPNAGEKPDVLVGRDELFTAFEILLQRTMRGRSARSMIVTGLRGVGKTVLLDRFRELALGHGWSVLEMEVDKFDDGTFRQELALRLRIALLDLSPRSRWTERFKRASAALSAFSVKFDTSGQPSFSLNVSAIEGLADHANLSLDLTDVFLEVGAAAQEKRTGLILLFDEIQFLSREQFSALIMALHKTVQRKLPIVLVGAGLPQLPELAGDAKSYSERLFTFPEIGNLNDEHAKEALQGPALLENVRFAPDALALAVEVTAGYPYFIQELGWAAWNIAATNPISKEDIDLAIERYQTQLDASFFRVRFERTSAKQAAYLRAMAELGAGMHSSGDIAEVLGKDSTQVGNIRAELIELGLIYAPQRGYAAFTVPHFEKFMRRAMPRIYFGNA